MPEFFNVLPPERALRALLERLTARTPAEAAPTAEALGRVTAEAVCAPEDLPAFPRSTVDGFSLRAADTYGATEGAPAYFDLVGEVPMGQPPQVSVAVGQAVGALTGGMLAAGADAVVMVEHTQQVEPLTTQFRHGLEVVRPVAPGENVAQVGEDVGKGQEVLPAGQVLRPQDLGALMALGLTQVQVARRPRVAILSLGDEVIPPDAAPLPGQVRDINSYTVSALVAQAGGIPIPLGIVPDDAAPQLAAARRGLAQADVLVISAGSSVSARDMTAWIIGQLGAPGVLAHGLALRPGKPAVIGLAEGKPAFGLPGNPVSAMIVFDLLVRPTLYHLCGCPSAPEPSKATARLSQNVASAPGREDYVAVRLRGPEGQRIAEPVFGKSNLIFTLVRADGLVKVPLDRGGLYAGEEVTVRLF